VAIFTGLRISELRGLRWCDVDLKAGEIHVRQRADRYRVIGSPKSAAAQRTVPFGKFVSNTLKEWKLQAKNSLVFPNTVGRIDDREKMAKNGLRAAQVAGGMGSKYPGFHCLRHFFASWCIDRGLPPKVIQERLGHSSITLTFDVYAGNAT
jgi:integrase